MSLLLGEKGELTGQTRCDVYYRARKDQDFSSQGIAGGRTLT